jgi:hypothetical protein
MVESYRDSKVRAGEVKGPFSDLLVHVSVPTYLTVCGRTYSGVRGVAPFYLEIPELDSILFVTEDKADNVTFHVLNLKTEREIAIDAGNSIFGGHIGGAVKPGHKNFADYVESVHGRIIRLVHDLSPFGKVVIDVNLDSARIEHQETLEFKGGSVASRSSQ